MGQRGPIGKRSDQKMGHRTKAELAGTEKFSMEGTVEVPDLDLGEVHPLVRDLYNSLKESGQSHFYEPSDWQVARIVCQQLNRYLCGGKQNSQMFGELMSAFGSLMMTEGDRRRLKLEIDRAGTDDSAEKAHVAVMDDYRKKAFGG